MDSRVTLENFLQGCAGKVTVLVGPAGSGKTLLMSCLGQQWAHGLVRLQFDHQPSIAFVCIFSSISGIICAVGIS